MNEFEKNIDYSKEWLVKEIIKTSFEQKTNHYKVMLEISKIDLLNLILKFIKLNELGG